MLFGNSAAKESCGNIPKEKGRQMPCRPLQSSDALLIVDVQNDFCEAGALPVPESDKVVETLNDWIAAAKEGGASIIASRDWHPSDHVSFHERGGPWPRHCVQETPGAQFHPSLNLPENTHVVSKGTLPVRDNYSALEGTGLAERLRRDGVRRLFVGGLALDVCVRATVLDAIQAGFEVHLLKQATRPVDPQAGRDAIQEMRRAGAIVEE